MDVAFWSDKYEQKADYIQKNNKEYMIQNNTVHRKKIYYVHKMA